MKQMSSPTVLSIGFYVRLRNVLCERRPPSAVWPHPGMRRASGLMIRHRRVPLEVATPRARCRFRFRSAGGETSAPRHPHHAATAIPGRRHATIGSAGPSIPRSDHRARSGGVPGESERNPPRPSPARGLDRHAATSEREFSDDGRSRPARGGTIARRGESPRPIGSKRSVGSRPTPRPARLEAGRWRGSARLGTGGWNPV